MAFSRRECQSELRCDYSRQWQCFDERRSTVQWVQHYQHRQRAGTTLSVNHVLHHFLPVTLLDIQLSTVSSSTLTTAIIQDRQLTVRSTLVSS